MYKPEIDLYEVFDLGYTCLKTLTLIKLQEDNFKCNHTSAFDNDNAKIDPFACRVDPHFDRWLLWGIRTGS